jgi:hypothetical protein
MTAIRHVVAIAAGLLLAGSIPLAQQTALPTAPATQDPAAGRGRGGPPVQGAEEDLPLVAKFDRNADKGLDHAERTAAREYLSAHPELRRALPRPRIASTGTPGAALEADDVTRCPDKVSLYDPGTVRTLSLSDWEQELAAFYHTDVEVPATLVVDGKRYRDVGVSFRGNNSFTAVPDGLKRPADAEAGFRPRRSAPARLPDASVAQFEPGPDVTALLYLDVS